MSSPRSPRSYDDIVRETVPLPDSSMRPTRDEALQADERPPGPRISARFPEDETEDQAASLAAVRAALEALQGADLADLDVTLEGGRAELSGSVADESDRDRIVRSVAAVHGVIAVIDTIRVRSA